MTTPSEFADQPEHHAEVVELSARQRAFLTVLSDRRRDLADMYIGALIALNASWNPDRISQAANSIRELIEKLPRFLGKLPIPTDPADMKAQVRELSDAWTGAKENLQSDSPPSDRGRAFISKLDTFFNRFQHDWPTRKETGRIMLRALDPLPLPMPDVIEEERATLWRDLRTYFDGVAHHRGSSTEEFASKLDALEDLLLHLLRPRTVEHQTQIEEIVREAEGS